MAKEFFGRELSACEMLIMKAVWSYDGDIPLKELMIQLRDVYHKDYARTTVATFLTRLHNKGYIETYRIGRASFTHPLKTLEEFREKLIREEIDFWFDGKDEDLVSAMCRTKKLTDESKDNIHTTISNN